jgi:hypothetical protein
MIKGRELATPAHLLYPSSLHMAKEHFFIEQTKSIHKSIEKLSAHGFSRQTVFEDWLQMIVCALSGGRMEVQYLEIVKKYGEGEKGSRPIDILAQMFADLVTGMEETKSDILGDYFMGAITYGAHGQFFTPESITDMMAQMVGGGEDGTTVSDPACGSGRTLLSAAKINPRREFFGQDLDHRCVQMTVVNLALNGLSGYVTWGNSLAFEQRLIYRTGFNGSGVISVVEPKAIPEPAQEVIKQFPVEGEQYSMFEAA